MNKKQIEYIKNHNSKIDKILDKLIGKIEQNHTNDEKVGSINRDLAYEYQMDRVKEV